MPNLQQQHVQRVMQLYRQILKNTLNWAVNREVFYAEAARIRGEFDKNKIVPDPATAEALVKRAEAALKENQHPDPYIAPYRPGGSLFERNPPFPPGMHQVLDFGKESYDK